ncbi:MAG: DUF624 domain-containing protein [Ruminococcus sp.]|uniref:DUF624 domain-containing protein n=1 Tax=Ruminococcus sp. TaxID=41978 RepID=UPI00260079F7|nr:DUF624 domain-containing protein [Ruminococcus sp.]MCR5601700.1 DUF624 domain-containing protein [Ruminococcus sp.]
MGLFSKDYESAGVGISKNAPKKKGAALFFDIIGRKLWKMMELNLLYMLFFLPLIMILPIVGALRNHETAAIIALAVLILLFMLLIGPATAGLTKVLRLFFINKHSFIVRDFFNGFKSNFKNAAIVGFLNCLIILSAIASWKVYPYLAAQTGSKAMFIPMIIAFSLFLVIIMMNHYIYLMMIATSLSLKNLIKNSFALAFVAVKQNFFVFIISLVTLAIMVVLMLWLMPVFLLLVPFFPAAFLYFLNCFVCYPVVQKYVINPYYTSIGEVNPELVDETPTAEERVFEDMGGKEAPVEKRKKGKGKRIS